MLNRTLPCLLLLAIALLAGGCARQYRLTLSNGNTITTKSKPKLNPETGAYIFKDAEGKPASLPRFRVRQIEPL